MRNKNFLELIKHYWYLGILFGIFIVVLIIGTNQEKPWSESLAITESKSSIAEVESSVIESEDSSAEAELEDKNNVSRIDSELFFLSDRQAEVEET